MSTLGLLNLPQQRTYNKGVFLHKVLNNSSPNCLAQLFISHQSHYTNSRNNLYVPRPRLDLFNPFTAPSYEMSGLKSSCIRLLHSIFSGHINNLLSILCVLIKKIRLHAYAKTKTKKLKILFFLLLLVVF